jgi:beta-glucosidase-like glycosyl hydrolase
MAASFNVTLWRTVGATISTEARAIANTDAAGENGGAINFWAPNMNLVRAVTILASSKVCAHLLQT